MIAGMERFKVAGKLMPPQEIGGTQNEYIRTESKN